jgi:xylulokinase
MYTLGFDLGSSSLKASLLDIGTGKIVASAQSPAVEMPISSPQPGWAEQEPEMWWENLCIATNQLAAGFDLQQVQAIGIAYQMHGLVMVNKNQQVLRPAIIWCDSRAVATGEKALTDLGEEETLARLLNSPGNFTASRLRWVQQNEPHLFEQLDKFMLPGDYLALRLTGEARTTASGLSEGILWDFQADKPADFLLEHYQIPQSSLPGIVSTFGNQGQILASVAKELGISAKAKVSYRAGDQPNNAFSLNVLRAGEVATTAGTSGVVYGISQQKKYDTASRVNTFLHVNHRKEHPAYGILLCINGTGILNRWLRDLAGNLSYAEMNMLAEQAPAGSDGVVILPFGNGAERVLQNKPLTSSFHHIQFTRHNRSHLLRAAQEGIVFALQYGLEVMAELGVATHTVRAGEANMFLSPVFRETFVNTTGAVLELLNTDGAAGAARGAALGADIYAGFEETFQSLAVQQRLEPDEKQREKYAEVYSKWREVLEEALANE